jgi:acyl-CoA reductase-like NAD-dependent aldehyde dehydrogenase
MAQKTILFTHFDNVIGCEACTSPHLTRGIDPSTGSLLWEVPIASEDDLNQAVTAAQNAFTEWSWTLGKKRQGLLAELREVLLRYREEMVELIMKETGKPVRSPLTHSLAELIHTH